MEKIIICICYDIIRHKMGIVGVIWRCPYCNLDAGGSMGELKNHIKNAHIKNEVPQNNDKMHHKNIEAF